MPSEELLRRLEALNGGPLREALTVDAVVAADRGLNTPEPAEEITNRAGSTTARRSRRPAGDAIALCEALPGEERAVGDARRYYHIERYLADHADWCAGLGEGICAALPGIRSGRTRRGQAPPQPHEVTFLDIETMGLDMEAPVFLVGLVAIDGEGRALCRQMLARTLEEENAAVAAAAEAMQGTRLLVSFNGRSYDLPLLRNRVEHFGGAWKEPAAHVDMLLEARRRYSRKLPNCRLQTLEARVCGRTRIEDVPSKRIPGVYRQFLKTGDASQLQKVIHHNLLDLATTAELFTLFFG